MSGLSAVWPIGPSSLADSRPDHLVTRLVLREILRIKPHRFQLLVDKQLHLVGIMR